MMFISRASLSAEREAAFVSGDGSIRGDVASQWGVAWTELRVNFVLLRKISFYVSLVYLSSHVEGNSSDIIRNPCQHGVSLIWSSKKKVKFWIYLLFCYFSSSNFNLKTLHRLFVFKQKIHKKTKINRKIDRGAHLETLHAPKCDQILSFFNYFFVYGFCSFFFGRKFDQWYKLLFLSCN